MTTTTRNEAAERLRKWPGKIDPHYQEQYELLLDKALAAERGATVERIRAAMIENGGFEGENLDAILDDEAKR